jgi:hypothetical protein
MELFQTKCYMAICRKIKQTISMIYFLGIYTCNNVYMYVNKEKRPRTPICCGLYLKCPPKAHELKAWPPVWCYWEVMKPLRRFLGN